MEDLVISLFIAWWFFSYVDLIYIIWVGKHVVENREGYFNMATVLGVFSMFIYLFLRMIT